MTYVIYGAEGVVDELRPVEHGSLVLSGGVTYTPNWRDLAGVLMEYDFTTTDNILAEIKGRFNHLPKEQVLAAISLAREELDRREDEIREALSALFLAGVAVEAESEMP